MKTIEVTLYTFDELSDKAKEFAINEHRDINVDYDWYQCTKDEFDGLGVVIKSFDLYRRQIELDFKYNLEDVCQSFVYEFNNNSIAEYAKRYLEAKKKLDKTYENEFDEWGECEEYDEERELLNSVFIEDLEEELLSWLDSEYEYLQSDEAIAETLEANEYDFDINGKVLYYEN
jgi:hypothetical protein